MSQLYPAQAKTMLQAASLLPFAVTKPVTRRMISKAVTPRDAKVLFGETLGDSFIGSMF
jgi:hypothetical protein